MVFCDTVSSHFEFACCLGKAVVRDCGLLPGIPVFILILFQYLLCHLPMHSHFEILNMQLLFACDREV